MKILAIETSCDETAISILEATGGLDAPAFSILSQVISSQIDMHREWGGVVPNIAKREHQKLLVPVLLEALTKAEIKQTPLGTMPYIKEILHREEILLQNIENSIASLGIPEIDYIAVTAGPGLEPALWVGINFARALGELWQKPVIGINHMEGHIMSPLLRGNTISFPAVALLISGGHTELIQLNDWHSYTLLGMTRDDAIGEAFDKVARMLDLPYPGGPEISKLALRGNKSDISLPRPMINSDNLDFSFSGLKTAVKYYVNDHSLLSEQDKCDISLAFEEAATEVIISKTKRALEQSNAKTLIVGGGVIANTRIRTALEHLIAGEFSDVTLLIPSLSHCGDNASMIAAAAYIRIEKGSAGSPLEAHGSMMLTN
ncbi:MAG: tRNA (adenosine(37)-N6)-threonylcarbamoyltransferase complex transferase subunit TsaD [bacterium]|nr:tRNA (adenosine(37)-N6)-threonylcarbamoyltransferase complex transferase subunit TsaD [bacterium]